MADELIMKAGKSDWSLDCDEKLLELMKNVSHKIEIRSQCTKSKINAMLNSVEDTKVQLHNLNFNSMKNVNYIENRIFDDGESNTTTTVPDNLGKVEPIRLLPETALKNGVILMNNCFEKVILNLDPDSDLDEDNGESNVAYRPIDKFVCTLPALIGSDKWKEKWHCGLVESNDESSGTDTDNNYSEDSPSVSSKMDIEQTASINQDNASNLLIKSVEPQVSYEQPAVTTVKPSAGLFDLSDGEETLLPPKSPITNIVEVPAASFFREQVPRRKLVNLFDDQPPDLPPNEPEDSDQDIFDTPVEITKKVIAKQPVDLFNDNEFDSYIKTMETSQQKTKLKDDPLFKEAVIVKKPLTKITNLFDDEIGTEDYFDEIMKNKIIDSSKLPVKSVIETNKIVKVVPVVVKSSKISNLFSDDSPDDDFDDLFAKKPVEIMKTNIFDEKKETSEKRMEPIDLFGNSSSVDYVMIPALNEKPPEIDWETEDDNYEDPFEKSSMVNEKVSQSISFTSVPMFDDLPPDDDFDSKKSAKLESSSIFLDDDDEPDMVQSFNISNDVINDEPPPLSDDETDRSISVKEKLSKFNNIEKASGQEEKVKKVLPKKLNTSKFNINVNALLPGSRLPPLTSKLDESLAKESIEDELDQKVVENLEPKQENSNILNNNLTKSRVRNVKKRPSTRHGRETLYKKNLSDETVTDSIENKETIKSTEQTTQSLFNDVEDEDVYAAVLEKSVVIKKLFDDEPEPVVVETPQAVDSDPLKVHKTFTTNKSMFYDDKNDVIQTLRMIKEDEQKQTIAKSLEDDKVFKKVNVKVAVKAKVYVESTSDDDLFGPSNVQELPEKLMKTSVDLFGSSSSKAFKPVNNDKSNLKDKPKHKIVSLFDDDFDDCDDLFSSSKTNVVTSKVISKTGSLFDDEGDIFSKTKSIAVKEVEKPTKPKINTKSLFDDSEDDDLFNTKSNVNSKADLSSVKIVKKVIDNPLNI